MNRRGTPVDFGPLFLPVGETPIFQVFGTAEASLEDVTKLHQLLSRQHRHKEGDDASLAEPSGVVFHGDALHQTHILMTLAELLPELASSVAVKTLQQADIELSSAILVDTRLRVRNTSSRIEFYFQISNDEAREWLQQHLAWLAKTVGERLGRDVRIAVSGAPGSHQGELVEEWHSGTEV